MSSYRSGLWHIILGCMESSQRASRGRLTIIPRMPTNTALWKRSERDLSFASPLQGVGAGDIFGCWSRPSRDRIYSDVGLARNTHITAPLSKVEEVGTTKLKST